MENDEKQQHWSTREKESEMIATNIIFMMMLLA